jgi:tetratricopeptide (TPR) repeat protein
VRWPYYLAHLYRLRGESVKAAAYFERALQIRPDEAAALVWLGEMYVDQGRPEQAEPLFTRALSRQPRLLAARFGLGRAALAKRDYVQAVEHLEAALALDRRASVIHYPLAMAYRRLGKLDLAEAHARQRGEVEIGPPDPLMQEVVEALQSVVTYENRGDRAFARGEYAAAAADFRKGLELAPDKLSVRHKLAATLSLTGDVPGAVRQFQEVLRRSPTFAGAHYSLGVLLQADGQYDLAIDRFSAAVQYDPTYLEARLQLAHALRRRGRSEAALRQYAEAIKMDPRLAEARFGYAMALVRLNRYQDARDWLSEAMNLHPDRREFAQALARLLAAAPDSHVRDGRRALALTQELIKGPQTGEVRETMAMVLAEIGEYDEAVTWQREAIAASQQAGEHTAASPMGENLKRYERRQPCRTPWRDDLLWESR